MITIKTDGQSWVEIEGHAGYAEPVKDIVWGVVSIVWETLTEQVYGMSGPNVVSSGNRIMLDDVFV